MIDYDHLSIPITSYLIGFFAGQIFAESRDHSYFHFVHSADRFRHARAISLSTNLRMRTKAFLSRDHNSVY